MKSLHIDFEKSKQKLKKTITITHGNNLQQILATEPNHENISKTRDYFFQSSVDEWYNKLTNATFRSEFISITKDEAQIIIQHWKQVTSSSEEEEAIPIGLENLVQRIDATICNKFSVNDGVFIKLSTRSPKDSKTIFRKSTQRFRDRIAENRVEDAHIRTSSSEDNMRMIAMSEEMLKGCAIYSGLEAVQILCDSHRVAEDLMYAYEEGDKDYEVSIVVRAWDPRINPACEFRGFVWNRQLNCIGQYWHSLYFPHLQDVELQKQIGNDCLQFFESLKESLPVPNAMLDLAWFGPGEVLLIEVNPLMEGLGSFKGSTGLFDYYSDANVLQGSAPFEIRVRNVEESRSSLISHMSMEWRRVVFGF